MQRPWALWEESWASSSSYPLCDCLLSSVPKCLQLGCLFSPSRDSLGVYPVVSILGTLIDFSHSTMASTTPDTSTLPTPICDASCGVWVSSGLFLLHCVLFQPILVSIAIPSFLEYKDSEMSTFHNTANASWKITVIWTLCKMTCCFWAIQNHVFWRIFMAIFQHSSKPIIPRKRLFGLLFCFTFIFRT